MTSGLDMEDEDEDKDFFGGGGSTTPVEEKKDDAFDDLEIPAFIRKRME